MESDNPPKTKPKRSLRLHGHLVFWCVLLLSFCMASGVQLSKYNELAAKEKELRAQIAAEDAKAFELSKNEEYYKSDAFVEKIAREQLDLLRPDEVLYYNDALTE